MGILKAFENSRVDTCEKGVIEPVGIAIGNSLMKAQERDQTCWWRTGVSGLKNESIGLGHGGLDGVLWTFEME